MPIPRDMETIADQVRRAKEDEAARLSAPVRAFRGTEVFRGAR